jgi:lipoate-protein ligase A
MTAPFPRAVWRLIQNSPAPGAWNMAVDEAILEAAVHGLVPPTLRLYAWQPACLSLGYAQPASDACNSELAARGWELVRRPTGGRAILHIDELTYSVIGPQSEPRLTGSVLESYQRLSQALLEALSRMGIQAQASAQKPATAQNDPASPGSQNPVCFETPSNYEIVVQGKKVIGSAQARRQGGFLQHGSLPLSGDLTRIIQALAFQNPADRAQAALRLSERATTVEKILDRLIDWQSASQVFIAAFEQVLDLDLQVGELTPQELERTDQLVQEKYASPAWTGRV